MRPNKIHSTMRSRWVLLAAVAFITLTSGSSARANLIKDGGFEDPAVSKFTTFTAPATFGTGAPWVVIDGSVDVVNQSQFGGATAFEGTQFLDLDGNEPGTVKQVFPTIAGQVYVLSFAFANNPDGTNPGGGAPSATVEILSGPLLSVLFSHNTSTETNLNWTTFSGTFTANSSTTTLRFTSQDLPGSAFGILLDDVSIDPVVPEPASLALWGMLGVAGLWYARRRRRGKAVTA